MSENAPSTTDEDAPLKDWRQGDFALGVGGFVFAAMPDGSEVFDPGEENEGVLGLVAISQTCDIVRRSGGRHYVAVCPLVEIEEGQIAAIRKGRKPYLTDIENAPDNAFADLRRVMSVDKDLLRKWDRQDGFSSEEGRARFAAALERKFGQFAFPDDFDAAIESFRKRVWKRHNRDESPIGKIYRSLSQIRFHADPGWDAEERAIAIVAVMKLEEDREVKERTEISDELRKAMAEIVWPDGYKWAAPDLLLETARALSGEDIIASRRGDFDFLCY